VIKESQETDLRCYLADLERAGQLTRVSKEVDPRYEIAGVMLKAAQQGKPALLFENVKGHSFPVAANLCASQERLAMALGVSTEAARDVYRERVNRPLPAEVVRSGPCQEEVFSSVDLALLPIITAHELDAGPYITAGVVIVKDPRSGIYNASFQRILPLTKDRAEAAFTTRPSKEFSPSLKTGQPSTSVAQATLCVAIRNRAMILCPSQSLLGFIPLCS